MEFEKAFDDLVRLVACANGIRWINERSFEVITQSSECSLSLLTRLKSVDLFATVSDHKLGEKLDRVKDEAIPKGTTITVEVPRSIRSLVVVKDLESLLLIDGARRCLPSFCMVLPENDRAFFFQKDGDVSHLPLKFVRYSKAVKLWGLLENRSDHKDETSDSILFFGNRRIEISPIFHADDLKFDVAIDEIEKFVESSDKEEVKREIFRSELSDFLRDYGPATSFGSLIKRSHFFAQRLREGLSIYLATNSPAKLVQEARKEALNFAEKVEKIVSGLEVKGLAIPAAILLAIKELEKGQQWSLLNVIILVSTLLFLAGMYFVFRSLQAMIDPLQASIERSHQEFVERGLEVSNFDLSSNFQSLLNRIETAKCAAKCVLGLSLLPAIAVLLAILKPIVPADQTQSGLMPSGASGTMSDGKPTHSQVDPKASTTK